MDQGGSRCLHRIAFIPVAHRVTHALQHHVGGRRWQGLQPRLSCRVSFALCRVVTSLSGMGERAIYSALLLVQL